MCYRAKALFLQGIYDWLYSWQARVFPDADTSVLLWGGSMTIGSMANSLSLRINAHCVMLESKALANFSHFDPHCCFFTSAAFASHIPMFHWFKYVQVQVQQIATILRISFVFVCSSKHPCIIYYDHLCIYIYTYIYKDTYSYSYIYMTIFV